MTTSSPSLPRARAPRLAALAAAGLAAAAAAAGCGSSSSASSGGSAGDPAKAIPASAAFYLEATVRPTGKQRDDLVAAGTKILRTNDPAAKLRALIDKAGAKQGKTYEKDIKPWLGDKAAVAVTGFGAAKPQYAVVIDSGDDAKASALISGDSSYREKRSFEGTDYRYDAADGTAAGVVHHYLVIGSEPSFRQIVHLLDKGGASLASNQDLQDARTKVGPSPGFMFVDLQGLLRTVAGSAGTAMGPAQLSAVNGVFQHLHSFGVGISADADAVRMTMASVGGSGGTAGGQGPATSLPLSGAPADAWLALSQKDAGASIRSMLDSLSKANSGSGASTLSDTLAQFETATGLSVKNDLLSWMGDANIFVEGSSLPALGGALVVHSTDPARTRAAIARIKGLMRQFGQHVGAVPSGMSDGFTLRLGPGKPAAQIGLAGSRFVIAIGRQALRDAIHPASTLSTSPRFRSASGLLAGGAKPSFYLDFQTVTRFISLAAHNDASFAKAKPYLDAFTAIVGGGTGDGKAQLAVGLR